MCGEEEERIRCNESRCNRWDRTGQNRTDHRWRREDTTEDPASHSLTRRTQNPPKNFNFFLASSSVLSLSLSLSLSRSPPRPIRPCFFEECTPNRTECTIHSSYI